MMNTLRCYRRLATPFALFSVILTLYVSLSLRPAHAAINITEQPQSTLLNISPISAPAYLGYQDILAITQQQAAVPDAASSLTRYWYVVALNNSTAEPQTVYISNPRLIPLPTSIYLLDNKDRIINVINYGTGDYELPYSFIPGLTLPVTVSAGNAVTVIFSVEAAAIPYFPLQLRSAAVFTSDVQKRLVLHSVVAGGLIVLLIYFALSHLYQQTGARFWLACSCLILLALLGSLQEPIARWFEFMQFGHYILAALGVVFLLSMGKFTHSLFSRIPWWLRLLNLLLPAGILLALASPLTGVPAFLNLLCVPAYGAFQITICALYQDRRNRSLNRLLAVAWLLLSLTWALFLTQYNPGLLPLVPAPVSAAAALLSGMCALALCVLLAERDLSRQQIHTQARTIDDLNVFYDLFRNSAEGLYTSTLDGSLITINPAMCTLFGYADEPTMLREVSDTALFYADPNQRDILVGELLENKTVMGREVKGRKADGTEFWFSISCQLHKDKGSTYLSGSIFDITAKKMSEINLTYMATHDSLTGIYNRREFESALTDAVTNQASGHTVILLYLDLDRFKAVNDTCGHKAGDKLIKELAQQIRDTLGDRGMLARLGGDEFGVLMTSQTQESAYIIAMKLVEAVRSYRFFWENHIFNVGVSIGLLNVTEHHSDADQALFLADAACYLAKQQGRDQVYCYQRHDERLQQYEQELDWVQLLNKALQGEGFELFYQHYRPLNWEHQGDCFEILLRLRLSDGTLAEPADFMPTAERYNVTARIDRYVIQQTFNWLQDNPQYLAQVKCCNINLNGQSLADLDLRRFLLSLFERSVVPYDKIWFDICETTAAAHKQQIQDFIQTFAALGCHFALDNFGSGFSSYGCMKELPVHCIKIDGSFVKGLLDNPLDSAIISSFKDIAQARDIITVAECVEDESTLTQLGKLGIDYAQGNAVAPPAALKDYTPL